jgi:hypothetical protein
LNLFKKDKEKAEDTSGFSFIKYLLFAGKFARFSGCRLAAFVGVD